MKIRWLLLLTLLLASCTPEMPAIEPPTESAPIQTEAPATEAPIETQEPSPTEPPPTEEPVLSEVEGPDIVCAKLISPENGLELPAVGKVTFAWEPVDGADSYLLQFTLPKGAIITFETDETTVGRYMEAFGMSGEFEWNVAAFNVNGNEICTSIPFNFTKPAISKNKSGESSGECRLGVDWGCEGEGGEE